MQISCKAETEWKRKNVSKCSRPLQCASSERQKKWVWTDLIHDINLCKGPKYKYTYKSIFQKNPRDQLVPWPPKNRAQRWNAPKYRKDMLNEWASIITKSLKLEAREEYQVLTVSHITEHPKQLYGNVKLKCNSELDQRNESKQEWNTAFLLNSNNFLEDTMIRHLINPWFTQPKQKVIGTIGHFTCKVPLPVTNSKTQHDVWGGRWPTVSYMAFRITR